MLYLVTGAAGFIGSHISERLLALGHEVVGLDNLNPYYDPALKTERLRRLEASDRFSFVQLDVADEKRVAKLGEAHGFDRVIHLAAQAGVRYSLQNPFEYARSNLTGHLSILELCRRSDKRPMLIYASSSSVYGNSQSAPFREGEALSEPASLYAATKQADEMMSASYSNLYGLAQVGVRFFTVYGPRGRPDMAYWLFAESILRNEPIRVFNHGKLKRDFTYIDDVVSALEAIATGPALTPESGLHRIYNVGNNRPVELTRFISELENVLGRRAVMQLEPMQPGDVLMTCADITRMGADYGWTPRIGLAEGLQAFVDWFVPRFERTSGLLNASKSAN